MDPNQVYLFMLSMLNPYIPNFSLPVPKLPPKPIAPPSKYKRTWKKDQVEEVFIAASKYSQERGINIEDLTISDFEALSTKFEQTAEQIMAKVNEVNKSGTLRPGIWSAREDELLVGIIKKGIEKWGQLANVLNKEIHTGLKVRTGKQCKERWNNYLNPQVNRGPWTDEEDMLALENYKIHGNKWSIISNSLKNRTESSVKNRIKSLLNKIKQDLRTMDDLLVGIDKMILLKNKQIQANPVSKLESSLKKDQNSGQQPNIKKEDPSIDFSQTVD